jgi:sodium/potassium/calcium exchanger 6
MTESCTSDKIIGKSIEEICELAKNCEYDFININEFHYCYMNGNLWLSLPIIIFLGLLCFYLLSDTANKYLSQALTNISDKLNLSQNLAGVTFLAFANGAPDVISSIVAGEVDSTDAEKGEGLDISIAALLGGGIFVSSLVFSLVILLAKTVKV